MIFFSNLRFGAVFHLRFGDCPACRQPSSIGTCLFSLCDHSSIKKGEIKKTNGFNRGKNCISNEKSRIDRIFFDSRDDVCTILTKERLCADNGN